MTLTSSARSNAFSVFAWTSMTHSMSIDGEISPWTLNIDDGAWLIQNGPLASSNWMISPLR